MGYGLLGGGGGTLGGISLGLGESFFGLGDRGLLFFECFLQVGETLGGFGLGGGSRKVGGSGEFVGASREGFDCRIGVGLRLVERPDFGGVRTFKLGNTNAGGLCGDLSFGDVGLGGGDLGVDDGEGGAAGLE